MSKKACAIVIKRTTPSWTTNKNLCNSLFITEIFLDVKN